jgi:hypothetical protein
MPNGAMVIGRMVLEITDPEFSYMRDSYFPKLQTQDVSIFFFFFANEIDVYLTMNIPWRRMLY